MCSQHFNVVIDVQALVSFCVYQAVNTICYRIYCIRAVTIPAAENCDVAQITMP